MPKNFYLPYPEKPTPPPRAHKKIKISKILTLDKLIKHIILTIIVVYATLNLTYEKGVNTMTLKGKNYILEMVKERLEEHRQKNGKKFSTYYEGHARMVVDFENAMNELKIVAQGVDFLWESLKQGQFGEEYHDALATMRLHGELVVEEVISMLAMIEKLGCGVVHEPKE